MKNITIHLNSSKSTNVPRSTCHVLPCSLDSSGPSTSVAKYFKITKGKRARKAFTEAVDVKKESQAKESPKVDEGSQVEKEELAEENESAKEDLQVEDLSLQEIKDKNTKDNEGKEEDSVPETYFRGRLLLGSKVEIPGDLEGVVLKEGQVVYSQSNNNNNNNNNNHSHTERINEPTKLWTQVASFDSVMVWGHENVPSCVDDHYLTGIGEWSKLAHLIHDPVE